MAKLVLEIADEDYQNIIEALASLYGYGQSLNFSEEVDTLSKEDFFKEKLVEIIREKVKNYLNNQQLKVAEDATRTAVEAIGITIA